MKIELNATRSLNCLEDYKKLFDDLYGNDYQIIIIISDLDLIMNYNEYRNNYNDYFKYIFGNNTILLSIPNIALLENETLIQRPLIRENTILLYVKSNDNDLKNDKAYFYGIPKK
jgi:hypothetical protein